jgi:hypothetical protein
MFVEENVMIGTISQSQNKSKNFVVIGGLMWLLWRRQRYAFGLTLLYVAVASLVLRCFRIPVPYSVAILSPLMLGIIAMIGTVSVDSTPVREYFGYPSYLLVTPIQSRLLALIPMLFGAVTMLAVSTVFLWLIVLPEGFYQFQYGPLLLVGLCMWCQAICWLPFSNALAKGLLIGAVTLATELWQMMSAGMFGQIPFLQSSAILVDTAYILLAYPVASFGLSLTRRGDRFRFSAFEMLSVIVGRALTGLFRLSLPRNRFKAAADGYLWSEWSTKAISTSYIAFTFCIVPTIFLFPLALLGFPIEAVPNRSDIMVHILPQWELLLNPQWVIVGCSLLVFLNVVAFVGSGHARQGQVTAWRHIFVKPISDFAIVAAKLKLVTKSFIITSPAAFAWLFVNARYGESQGPLLLLMLVHGGAVNIIRLLLTQIVLLAVIWNFLASLAVLECFHASWLRWMLLWPVLLCAFTYFVYALVHIYGLGCLPFVVVGLSAIKLISCGIATYWLLQRGVITWPDIKNGQIAWLLFAIIVSSFAVIAVPTGLLPIWAVLASVVFALPGIVISLAPLAVNMDRHQ